jgi:hypothetical protein
MSFLAAAAIAVSAYSAWQSVEEGKAEASAFKDAARAKQRQAKKLMERAKMNEGFTRLKGKSFQGQQKAAFASSGVDISSGIALSAFEDTARKIERQIEIDMITARAEANSILMGADLDLTKAGMAQSAGEKQAFSQIMQTGFMLAK